MAPNTVLRAKIKIGYVQNGINDNQKTNEQIHAHGVYSLDPESENAQWAKATPGLNLNMSIDNPGAFGRLEQGKEYFIDFIPCEVSEPQDSES